MKPFVFQFKESPTKESLDYSLVEYDEHLNLTLDKKNGKPAIEILELDTETFTKVNGEASDSDDNTTQFLIDTETRTYTALEAADSDKDRDRKRIQTLMDTTTITESRENLDQDK